MADQQAPADLPVSESAKANAERLTAVVDTAVKEFSGQKNLPEPGEFHHCLHQYLIPPQSVD